MGMNIEDVLGNVKEALVKAAKEGKKKGSNEAYKNAIEKINDYRNHVKESVDSLSEDLIKTLNDLIINEEENKK